MVSVHGMLLARTIEMRPEQAYSDSILIIGIPTREVSDPDLDRSIVFGHDHSSSKTYSARTMDVLRIFAHFGLFDLMMS